MPSDCSGLWLASSHHEFALRHFGIGIGMLQPGSLWVLVIEANGLFADLGTSASIPVVKSDQTIQLSGCKLEYFKDVSLLSPSSHCF